MRILSSLLLILFCWSGGCAKRTRVSEGSRSSMPPIYRHIDSRDQVADVEVTITWSNAKNPGGKESFLLRKIQPGEEKRNTVSRPSANWDGTDGFGNYSVGLDTSHENWTITVDSSWVVAGVAGHLRKDFAVVPFATKRYEDGNFAAEIFYNDGSKKKEAQPVAGANAGATPRHGSS
jgi:hypothetical protein